ncbi:TIGR04219 family outer membrane beta-barrel protein [Gilvimarinus sp. F26214L]|uniref:TIGR04219 family outer membrane beta-barrel protein n=1 Tax=Gilvimarinus sp. DZF01 TaxID=3461371 RepID=UPI0040466350
MNKLVKPLCLAGLLSASPLAFSDTILGIYAGGGVWQTDLSGEVGDVDRLGANLEDFGLDEQDNEFYYVALEHPIPLIPNIRLQNTDMSMSELSSISRTFDLDGQTYTAGETIASDLDFSHLDATLYYELLDNWVNLDLGLTFRKFDGEVRFRSETTGASSDQTLDETVPMVYGKAQFNLPLTGFYVSAGGNFTRYDDSDMSDLQAAVGYMSDGLVLDFGVEVGVRNFSVQLDDVSDLDADLDLEGAFASIYLHF